MSDTIASIPAPWGSVVLVCRKCSRKLDGGFGKKGKHALADALEDALDGAGRGREVLVAETDCLDICPKRAVAVLRADRPGEVLTVPAGADPEAVLARLMGQG